MLAKHRRMPRSPYAVVLAYLLSEQSLTSLNGSPPSELIVTVSVSISSPDRRRPLGSGHCASRTLPLSNGAWPVSLRHVAGFPRLGLLRRLRDHGARAR